MIGIEGRISVAGGIDNAVDQLPPWKELGATHVAVNTMGAGFESLDQHLNALRLFMEACHL